VLAGTIAALGLHLLLTALGLGAGLAPFRPLPGVPPITPFSAGAALAWSLFALIALSLGGWVAGRLTSGRQCGPLHGLLVWSLTLILTLPLLLALGASLALAPPPPHPVKTPDPNLEKLAAAERELALTVTKREDAQQCSFVEEAVQSIPTNSEPKADTRAEREVGFAVTKLFAPVNAAAFPANRLEAINALEVYTAMTPANATTTLDAWINSRENLQVELDKLQAEVNRLKAATEQNTRATGEVAQSAANLAAHRLSQAATWSFFALLLGLLGAVLGGRCGAEGALRGGSAPCPPVSPV
jgi:hypothetical protein